MEDVNSFYSLLMSILVYYNHVDNPTNKAKYKYLNKEKNLYFPISLKFQNLSLIGQYIGVYFLILPPYLLRF